MAKKWDLALTAIYFASDIYSTRRIMLIGWYGVVLVIIVRSWEIKIPEDSERSLAHISVLSFWATTEAATVDKREVCRRAYDVSVLPIALFVFATATNINGMHAACSIHTGSTANLANDFLTRNRASQELAATCKYAFRKFILFESICWYLLLQIMLCEIRLGLLMVF